MRAACRRAAPSAASARPRPNTPRAGTRRCRARSGTPDTTALSGSARVSPRGARRAAFGWALAAAALALGACGQGETNFSQYPGFAEYFAARPRSDAPPDQAARALLARYRPRFFLPAGHAGLIDFYADYVAQGVLTADGGRTVVAVVTPEVLNRYRSDARAVFVHAPSGRPARATVFGRVDREDLRREDGGTEPFTFLTYNAVFRHSGLPVGMAWWQEAALGLVASLDDWHQLDQYTAATVVLDGGDRPVALMLQQHNGVRSYLFGRDVALPADGRVAVDVAIRSNELYPHLPGRTVRRAVAMPSFPALRYLLTGADRPLFAADDVTDPAAESDYALAFLPPADAFYSFAGFLGERRLLPGRSGPPGADYNTVPALKPRLMQLFAGYLREGDGGDLRRLEAAAAQDGGHVGAAFARLQEQVFLADRACLARAAAAC